MRAGIPRSLVSRNVIDGSLLAAHGRSWRRAAQLTLLQGLEHPTLSTEATTVHMEYSERRDERLELCVLLARRYSAVVLLGMAACVFAVLQVAVRPSIAWPFLGLALLLAAAIALHCWTAYLRHRRLLRMRSVDDFDPQHLALFSPALVRLAFSDRDFNAQDYELLLELDNASLARGHGLEEEQIDRLPILAYDGSGSESKCAICLQRFVAGSHLRILPCLHRFCRGCVDPWLSQKAQCPVCNHVVNVLAS